METSNDNARDVLNVPSRYQALLCSAEDYTNDDDDDLKEGGKDRHRYEFDFDIVVSNLTYIPEADMSMLTPNVIWYTSRTALCGGISGMDAIWMIVRRMTEWTGGKADRIIWMEVDLSHLRRIKEWLMMPSVADEMGVEFIKAQKDIYARDRFIKLWTIGGWGWLCNHKNAAGRMMNEDDNSRIRLWHPGITYLDGMGPQITESAGAPKSICEKETPPNKRWTDKRTNGYFLSFILFGINRPKDTLAIKAAAVAKEIN